MRSDLPEEDTSPTVLLLGFTRITTSPPATHPRRPQSLALAPAHNLLSSHQHRSNQHCSIITNENSAASRPRPVSIVHPYTFQRPSSPDDVTPVDEGNQLTEGTTKIVSSCSNHSLKDGFNNANSKFSNVNSDEVVEGTTIKELLLSGSVESRGAASTESSGTSGTASFHSEGAGGGSASANMEHSVDSIGTCSLDVDASDGELLQSDLCENPSVDTLRSASIQTHSTLGEDFEEQEQHQYRLPSYLSLACTVNGYSQSTNYDPVRLTKSRDSSPHRPLVDADSSVVPTYNITNNLLSPPNVVPLPLPLTDRFRQTVVVPSPKHYPPAEKMTEHTRTMTHHHQEFYSKKQMFISSETTTRKYNYISETVAMDRVDAACLEKTFNGHQVVKHEKTMLKEVNGHANGHMNGGEPKSFIQQRVERLYGPGALAQGFFVMKRQKSRNSESDAQAPANSLTVSDGDKHSKSMSDKLLLDADYDNDSNMKQSASSPSLPVLRHLTPEFRAQLPTFSPRRGADTILQKSTTLPQLKGTDMVSNEVLTLTQNGTETKIIVQDGETCAGGSLKVHENNNCLNGGSSTIENDQHIDLQNEVKDGHYFLRILENETIRLLQLADKAEAELAAGESKLNENAKGFLRSASGKARLLVSQKMQQFRGLCTNNLNQADGEAFPTTNQDLQGFWDMVMLQVDQIDSLFKELDTMRSNNWQEVVKPVDTVDRGKATRSRLPSSQVNRARSNAGVEEARAKREAQRKLMIEQRRKAMRESKSNSAIGKESIEIFVPESS